MYGPCVNAEVCLSNGYHPCRLRYRSSAATTSRRYLRYNRAEITAPRPNGRRTPAIGRHSDPHRGSRRDAVPGNESSASFEEHNIASVPPSLATSVVVHEDRHGSALGPRRKNRQNYIENDSTRQVRRSQQSDRPAPAAACQCVD